MIPLILLLAVGGLMQAARSFTTDTSLAGTELAFGFLLLSAYFTAKIVNRFGLPKLTGYLISGVLTGEFVLGFVSHEMTDTLKVVSDTATAILALEAGAELQLKAIKPLMKTLRGITVLAVIGSMFTIATALYLMRPWLLDVFGKYHRDGVAVLWQTEDQLRKVAFEFAGKVPDAAVSCGLGWTVIEIGGQYSCDRLKEFVTAMTLMGLAFEVW